MKKDKGHKGGREIASETKNESKIEFSSRYRLKPIFVFGMGMKNFNE